ncbi:TetR/AcrR family transcriptional regulator [Burkholderia cepacia]|nr:TetR/AcrR family transcriptional regulator [Burkholderia cepacia]
MFTREAILNASERCFLKQGYRSVSLEDIAKDAGVTRGAVYWHFKDKTLLLLEVFMRIRSRVCDELSTLVSDEQALPSRRLARFCRAMLATPNNDHISASVGVWMMHYEMFLAEPVTEACAKELFSVIHEVLVAVLCGKLTTDKGEQDNSIGSKSEMGALHLQALLIGLAQLRHFKKFVGGKGAYANQIMLQSIDGILSRVSDI